MNCKDIDISKKVRCHKNYQKTAEKKKEKSSYYTEYFLCMSKQYHSIHLSMS